MPAVPANQLTLSIESDLTPGQYLPVGGIEQLKLSTALPAQRNDTLSSGAWQSLLGVAGARSISISGSGLFEASAGETLLFGSALSGTTVRLTLGFASGTLSGPFLLTRYERSGAESDVVEVSLNLESAGELIYLAA